MKKINGWSIAVAASIVGWIGVAYITLSDSAEAQSPVIGTVVGVEKHSNDFGDRWIVVQPEQPSFGLWVTEACALTLSPGDDWPSADPACH